MPSALAMAVGPRPCALISRTVAASIEARRPLYTPAALALAMPSSCRSLRRFVSNSASHGSRAGLAVKAGTRQETLSPRNLVTVLNDTLIGHRVVIISACYSGVFIRPLADPDALIITAADADHTSFGFNNGNHLTYFGAAFFNSELRPTPRMSDAFALAC